MVGCVSDFISHLWVSFQKEQLNTKGRPFRGMSEEEVFTEVANLFRGQEDLLSEFGQFLPEAKRSLVRVCLERGRALSARFVCGINKEALECKMLWENIEPVDELCFWSVFGVSQNRGLT